MEFPRAPVCAQAHEDVRGPLHAARQALPADYAAIDTENRYWGDAVGVFRKPMKPSRLVRMVGEVVVWWANRVGGIDHVASPRPDDARRKAAVRS
jgi:hypothetical protein